MEKYQIISFCPWCGAPLMIDKSLLINIKPLLDSDFDNWYIPGIVYTCKCYRSKTKTLNQIQEHIDE